MSPFCSAWRASLAANSPGTEMTARFESGCWVKAWSMVRTFVSVATLLVSRTRNFSRELITSWAASTESALRDTTKSLLDAPKESIPS